MSGQPAGAPPPPATDAAEGKRSEAKAHFDKAKKLLDEGAWDAALAEFLASRKLYPNESATRGAAVCLKHLNRLGEALDLFEALLRDFADGLEADTKARVQQEIVELRGRVGTIEIEGAEAGASITVDGQSRGDFPSLAPLRVATGSHGVRVYKEGFEPFETRVDVAGGQTARVAARLRALTQSGRLHVAEQGGRAVEVLVDGNVVGAAPWEGALAVGEHTVVLRGAGDLGTQPVSVPVELGKAAQITLLAEALVAAVRIEPVPVGASVAVDSVVVGHGIWEGRLRAGKHRIEAAAAGFTSVTREVILARGQRETVLLDLPRDPRSPFWRRPPRGPHFVLSLEGAVPIVPSVGGDIAEGCTGTCGRGPGLGFRAEISGGYELASGFGFGASLGYLFASQTMAGRPSTIAPVGLPDSDSGTINDTIALRRGVLTGAWAGFSFGERVAFQTRLGAGVLFGSVTDTRTGSFAPANGGPRYDVGPLTVSSFTSFFYVAPAVRAGLRLTDHVEIHGGVEVLVLLPFSRPAWPSSEEVNAGIHGIGTFREEALLGGQGMFLLAPGIGARYDF